MFEREMGDGYSPISHLDQTSSPGTGLGYNRNHSLLMVLHMVAWLCAVARGGVR